MYDKSKHYHIPFIGGPLDGRTFALPPADRVVWPQCTEDGKLLIEHFYNLREGIDPKTAEVIQLQYHHQPRV